MSEIAIKVENLSKLYKIGLAKNRHDTLRDQIADWAKSLFRRNGGSPASSKQESAGRQQESAGRQQESAGRQQQAAGRSRLLTTPYPLHKTVRPRLAGRAYPCNI